MSHQRRRTLAVLAAAVLSAAPLAFAEVPITSDSPLVDRASVQGSNTIGREALEQLPQRRLLMDVLHQTPLGPTLESAGINIYGHAEAGWTANFDPPANDQNAFRLFDFQDQKILLDQLDLTIERRVDYRRNQFDVGGAMEWMWGADAGLIHANGVFDHYDAARSPQNQFDPVQFYVDVTLPVLNGMRVRAGKFANLVGFESINPTTDFIGFYSRSFVFGTGYPFTHTGVLGTVDLNASRTLTFTGGITRGDDQSFEDNNDSWAFLGSLNWVINKNMALYIANSTGPEQTNNDSDYRTTWDATLYWQATERCRFLANGYFIYDAAGASDGRSGYLYSVALLGSYQMCKEAAFKVRGEYFHDQDGLRIPAGTSLYEVTVGLDVTPLPHCPVGRNLTIRPEVRFDFSDDDVFQGESHQYTFGVDAIFKF
jgi:hypothetical protein